MVNELFYGIDRLISKSDQVAPNIPMGAPDDDSRTYLEEYTHLRNDVFSKFLNTMEEDERFYRLEFGDDIIPQEWKAKGFYPTLPPTAYNAVEAASNHILTTPDILCPERPTEAGALDEQEIAALKGTALLYFWHQVFKSGDPMGHSKKDLIKYGKLVLKKELLFDLIDAKATAVGRRNFPWRVRQIAPSQVFEDPTNPYDPLFVYEAYETTRIEAERLFPEAKGTWRQTKDRLDNVRVLEYWEKPRNRSRGKRIIWVEDERVINKHNPYYWVDAIDDRGNEVYCGYVPYFFADSGWGDGDVDAAPHERYVGMIRRIHSLLRTEARQLTAADAQLRISTFPLIKLTNIEEDDEHPIKIGPGAKIHVDDTQNIEAVKWPGVDSGVFALLSHAHQYVNELAQFQTLSGSPQRGVDSATEADQNYRSASSKMRGVIDGMRSVITRMNETVLQDIQYIIEGDVTLYGAADGMPGVITLKPEWIDGFWENFVELKTSDHREIDAANAMRWANLYQVFGLDRRYAMKMAGIANPPQRIAQRMQEDVWLDPRAHEMRFAATVAGQGGEFGEMLALQSLQSLVNSLPTDSITSSGNSPDLAQNASQGIVGGFPGGPTGEDTARQNADAAQESPTGQANRAEGFSKALALRPDRQFGRSG